jgi:hypothetical protein
MIETRNHHREIVEERDRLKVEHAAMLEALKEAVALADRNLSQFSGRTPETQDCYDRCVAAITLAEGRRR